MNKKIGRLIRPNMGVYVFALLACAIASFLMEQYILAIAEAGATALLIVVYVVYRSYRRKNLQAFIQDRAERAGIALGGQTPFPLVAIRLEDGCVVYANDTFTKITGFSDTMSEKYLDEVLPAGSCRKHDNGAWQWLSRTDTLSFRTAANLWKIQAKLHPDISRSWYH